MLKRPIIDADGHVAEPFSLWQELPAAYREGAPRVVTIDGVERVAYGDFVFDLPFTVADFSTPGGFSDASKLGRPISEIPEAAYDPKARLRLLDQQGIDVAVLYPTLLLNLDMHPDGMRQAMAGLYNEWIADFCSTDPTRLKWVAPVSRNDLGHAVDEVAKAAEAGASAIFLSPVPTYDGRLIGSPAEDRLIAAIAETNLPVAIHASDPNNSSLNWQDYLVTRWMWDCGSAALEMQFALIWVFGQGLLDRFPELRVAFLEGNVGWFPWLINKMEMSYEHVAALHPKPAESPLETFRRRCWISGETEEPLVPTVAEMIGADRYLWASDFPHYECNWDPIEELEEIEELTTQQKQAMVCDSSLGFYGFEVPAVAPVGG